MNFTFVIKGKPFLILFLLFVTPLLQAQNNVIDSLQNELSKTIEDTARILLMNEIALSLYKIDQDSALQILKTAFPLAEKINYNAGRYELWNTKRHIYERSGQLDSAIIFLERTKEIALTMGDKKRLAQSLHRIGKVYRNKNKMRLAIRFLIESLSVATNIADKKSQFVALNSLGNVYSRLAVYDTSEIYHKQALALQVELGNKKYQAGILRNLGNNAGRANNLEKSLDYHEQAMLIMKEIGDKEGQAVLFKMMGFYCFNSGQLPNAINYFQNALILFEEIKNINEVAECYSDLSEIYASMNDYEEAILLIEKAHNLRKEHGIVVQKSDLLIRKGMIYSLKKDYKSALYHLNDALHSLKKNNVTIIRVDLYLYLGTCYQNLNQRDSAIYFLQKAVEGANEKNDFHTKSKSLKILGSIYFQQGIIDKAIDYLEDAIEIASIAGNKEHEMEASEVLYQIYKSQSNKDRALYYHERYRTLQDSLFNEKNVKQIARLEADYQFTQEKQQLTFERKQETQEHEAFQRNLWIALGIAFLLIIAIFWYNRLKQKANEQLSQLNEELKDQKTIIEKQKEKLEELDEAKSRFFTNISHEFRTPLTIISGMIDQVSAKPDLWLKKGSRMIKENTVSLLNLVNQILDLRKLESGTLELSMNQGDVIQYLRYITEPYQAFAESKGIQLHFLAAQSDIQMDYDPDKLLRIVSNLMGNAIKFTPDGGHIYFHINKKTDKDVSFLQIRIEDTGAGIPNDRLPNIFDLFFQADDSSTRNAEGTGIGLAFTKELVKLLNGEIRVTSELGKGTSFYIDLPITMQSEIRNAPFKPQTSFASLLPKVSEPFEHHSSNSNFSNVELPHLLIVEDNKDVAQFLIACLEDEYQLQVVGNGKEGIDAAIEYIPDLIVSDVMMPVKDGFELCDTLKQDERTSHIPIILLTAKADLDSKISGLERGADAYLTKPVEQKELLVRLKKLLELRKRLQERYGSLDFERVKNNNKPNPEDAFLLKVKDLVEENIADDSFGNAQLARKMNLSESQLYRKIKALTDKSPLPFIRSVRLHKGKELLQKTEMNVSEVAYEIGFTDPAYFSRAFSKEFGVPPNIIRK